MAPDVNELRDLTGRWAKSAGGIKAAHAAASTKISGIRKGSKIGLHGATIDNIPSKGLRVRIKGETRHHGTDHEAAAAAMVQGAHPERHHGAEGALRQVAGGRGKIPAPAPSPSPPKIPAGVPSEAELRDKTPDQLAEMANITRGQGSYPGRELTLQRIRSEQQRREFERGRGDQRRGVHAPGGKPVPQLDGAGHDLKGLAHSINTRTHPGFQKEQHRSAMQCNGRAPGRTKGRFCRGIRSACGRPGRCAEFARMTSKRSQNRSVPLSRPEVRLDAEPGGALRHARLGLWD